MQAQRLSPVAPYCSKSLRAEVRGLAVVETYAAWANGRLAALKVGQCKTL